MTIGFGAHGAYVAGEDQNLLIGRLNRLDGSRRGVLYGNPVGSSTWNLVGLPQCMVLADSGYPTFTSDLGGTSTWGNDTSITRVGQAKTWLLANGAKSGTVFLFGVSMGALAVLNWARQNPSLVAGVVLVIPVLDLNDVYQFDKGGFRAAIGTAYGVAYPTAIPNLSTHSPVAYPGDVSGFPIKVWAASDDSIASNTAACQAWASAVGSNVSVVDLGAVDHTLTGFDGSGAVAFFDANGGRS